MKILIVEDNTPFATALAAVLSRLAPKALVVETLDAAFVAIEGRPKIDTVILDLTLRDAGPHETLDAIKRMKEIGARVIVMTGTKSEELSKEIEISGAAAYFCKSDPDFVASLREELKNPSAHPFSP